MKDLTDREVPVFYGGGSLVLALTFHMAETALEIVVHGVAVIVFAGLAWAGVQVLAWDAVADESATEGGTQG